MYRLLPLNERRLDLREMRDYHNIYYKYCGILRCDILNTGQKWKQRETRNIGAHYRGTGWNIPENRHVETVRVFIQSFNLLVSAMYIS